MARTRQGAACSPRWHEFVHLLLHTEGLCDTTTDTVLRSPNTQLEARCNAVAAEILMPAADVLASLVVAEHRPGSTWSIAELLEGAKPYGVSVEAFLRRLVTLGSANRLIPIEGVVGV